VSPRARYWDGVADTLFIVSMILTGVLVIAGVVTLAVQYQGPAASVGVAVVASVAGCRASRRIANRLELADRVARTRVDDPDPSRWPS
jgi:hypothetical protein